MLWSLSPFTILTLVSAAVAVGVGAGALRHRPDPLAVPLAVLMFAVAAWAVPHGLSFGATDPATAAFWNQLRYPGTTVAPVAFMVCAVKYAGYEDWLTTRVYGLLGVIPVVSIVTVWSNPWHGLFWRSIAIDRTAATTLFTPEHGPVYWVDLSYLYAVTMVGLLLLAVAAARSGPLYRKQASLMFVGGLVPLTTNVALQVGLLPTQVPDLTTTALAATGITFALALYHFDLLELRPIARDRLLAELEDGVVVIGPDGRIRDFNPAAAEILDDLESDTPAGGVLPADVVPDGGEVVVERDGTDRSYRTRSTTLHDQHGRDVGRVVYLNDITELVRREQRISVLNRVLRHNVRNELNLARGHLELAEESLAADPPAGLEKAATSIDEVISFAERARYVERTIHEDGGTAKVDLIDAVTAAVERTREAHPDAELTTALPGRAAQAAAASVVDQDLLEMALDELLENAIRHNDRHPPSVELTVTPKDGVLQLRIADDGPGLPEEEVDVLTAPRETQLHHGSGLGLWLVRWTATLSEGDLSFAENDPRGSIVTLSLPRVTT